MVVRKIIPDAYTEYDDGRIGAVSPGLANIEAKIGAAMGGKIGKLYVLAGPNAKTQAKTIFRGGPLLRAIEEAFDAGSSTIYAWRIGPAQAAVLDLLDSGASPVIRLTALDPGSYGNGIEVEVGRELVDYSTAYWVLDADNNQVRKYDVDGNLLTSIDHANETVDARGVAWFAPDDSVFVLGLDASSQPMLWHYDNAGALVTADTSNLSAAIAPGEAISGLVFVTDDFNPGGPPTFAISTDKAFYMFEALTAAPTAPDNYSPYSLWGLAGVNIQAAGFKVDLEEGGGPQAIYAADPTTRKIYELSLLDQNSVRQIDLTNLVGGGQIAGMGVDYFTGELYLGLDSGPGGRIVRIDPENSAPTEADIDWQIITGVQAAGLYVGVENVVYQPSISIRDGNLDNPPVYSFAAQTNTELVDAINDGQSLVSGVVLGAGQPNETTSPQNLTGGDDGLGLTNGDYLDALDLTTGKPEISWIHPVGATSSALWAATLIHCQSMLDDYLSERFAILETPAFVTTAEVGGSLYLTDLQSYVDAIVAQMALVGDRNAVVFAGGAEFLDSDGNRYAGALTSACGGRMASLEVQKSLINKQLPNVLKLVPEFSPGQLQQLIIARVNTVRLKPGRGFVVAHSLTGAAPGSDYSRVNDLRAVYYGAKQARAAAQPYVGDENDEEGEGLTRLASAMKRPLEVMEDGGQIDAFGLRAESDENDRLLGDVYVDLGIKPLRAMEMIYTTVYLQ